MIWWWLMPRLPTRTNCRILIFSKFWFTAVKLRQQTGTPEAFGTAGGRWNLYWSHWSNELYLFPHWSGWLGYTVSAFGQSVLLFYCEEEEPKLYIRAGVIISVANSRQKSSKYTTSCLKIKYLNLILNHCFPPPPNTFLLWISSDFSAHINFSH